VATKNSWIILKDFTNTAFMSIIREYNEIQKEQEAYLTAPYIIMSTFSLNVFWMNKLYIILKTGLFALFR